MYLLKIRYINLNRNIGRINNNMLESINDNSVIIHL